MAYYFVTRQNVNKIIEIMKIVLIQFLVDKINDN